MGNHDKTPKSVDDIEDDRKLAIPGALFKSLVEERKDALEDLLFVIRAVKLYAEQRLEHLTCENGIEVPELIESEDGLTLNCICDRCTTVALSASMDLFEQGWDFSLLKRKEVRISYRTTPDEDAGDPTE